MTSPVPLAEVHPLLGVKGDSKSKKKTAGRPKGSKGKEKDSPFRPKLYGDRERERDRGLSVDGAVKGRPEAVPVPGKTPPGPACHTLALCRSQQPKPPLDHRRTQIPALSRLESQGAHPARATASEKCRNIKT